MNTFPQTQFATRHFTEVDKAIPIEQFIEPTVYNSGEVNALINGQTIVPGQTFTAGAIGTISNTILYISWEKEEGLKKLSLNYSVIDNCNK